MAVATTTVIALAAAAAAAGASYYNTQKTASNQDKAAAASIRSQSKIQSEADRRIASLVDQQKGSNATDEIASQDSQYLAQLQRGKAGMSVAPSVGNVSDAYAQSAEKAANDVNKFGTDRAMLLSRIDAPGLQRQNEGVTFNNALVDLGNIKRQSAGQSFLDQLKMKTAGNRNPWIDAAAAGLNGYAGAAGATGGGTAAAGTGGETAFGYTAYPDYAAWMGGG